MRRCVAVVILAGCGGLYGVDPSRIDSGPAPDVPEADVVRGTLSLAVIALNAAGHPAETDLPVPEDTVTVTVRLDDGTTPHVTYAAGQLSFARAAPGQLYAVTLAFAEQTIEFDSTAPELQLVKPELGRPDRQLITDGQPRGIEYKPVTEAVGFQLFTLYTTGVWSLDERSPYDAAALALTYDHATALTYDRSPAAELDAAKGDLVYLLELTAASANNVAYDIASEAQIAGVTTTPGAPTVLAAPGPVAPDHCVALTAPRAAEWARIQDVFAAGTTPTSDWQIASMPLPAVAELGMVTYAVASSPTPRDDAAPIHFPAIVPGQALLATQGVSGIATFTAPGATPLLIGAGTRVFAALTDDVTQCPSVDLTATVGIPTAFELGGAALDGASSSVTIDRSAPVLLRWSMLHGTADLYIVTVLEMSKTQGTPQTTLTPVYTGFTTALQTGLDPKLFVAGRSYVIAVAGLLGASGARDGDFRTIPYPREEATNYSPDFVISF